LLSEAGDILDLAAGAGEIGRQMVTEGWHIPLRQEQSLVGRAARTQQGVIVNNVREELGWLPNPLLPDTRSELAVPLIVGERVLGVLDVQADTVNHFTPEDVHIQTTLATQVAVALQNAALYRQTQDALEETLVLPQFSQALAGTLSVDKILDIFFEGCTKEIGFEYVQLMLVDENQHRIKAIAGVGVSGSDLRKANYSLDSDNLVTDIIRTGQTEIITDWDDRLDKEIFETEGHPDWVRVFAPVILRQEHIGVVEAGFNKKVQTTIRTSQIRLLGAFIDQTALALDNAQRYEASQRAARREQTIRQITEKMRAATTLDELVKVTAEELGERLSAGHTGVELGVE
jgi:GAF domain-containing protein